MTGHVKVSGTYKTVTPSVKVSGSWKALAKGSTKVSGVWKDWYTPGGGGGGPTVTVPALNPTDSTAYNPPFETSIAASISVLRNGTTQSTNESSPNWIDTPSPTIGDAYEVRLVVNSGSNPTGASLNTWLPLSSNRTWDIIQSGGAGSKASDCTLEIGLLGTSTALSSNTVTFTATLT